RNRFNLAAESPLGTLFFIFFASLAHLLLVLSLVFALCPCQIDQSFGNLLPLAALGAVVANTVSFHLVLADKVVIAIFQIKLEGFAEQEGSGQQEQQNCTHDAILPLLTPE